MACFSPTIKCNGGSLDHELKRWECLLEFLHKCRAMFSLELDFISVWNPFDQTAIVAIKNVVFDYSI